MHAFEHLFATCARNSKYSDSVIYVGPMGCRTGFYLLMRDNVSQSETIDFVRETFDFMSKFDGETPGSKRKECGNYAEHDIEGAKLEAAKILEVLKDWTVEDLSYER